MIRVILVGTLYPVNLGAVCRVMKNFGARELYLVRPQTEVTPEAIKYAKRARDILKNAKRTRSLKIAIKGSDYVIGTTGVVQRFKYALKKCVTPRDLGSKASSIDTISLVFGNEGTGLSLNDLKECDVIVTIPASKKYPVLNLSHSVAVLLYELFISNKIYRHYKPAKRKQVKYLLKMFSETIDSLPQIRDKRKVRQAFDNLLSRSRVSEDELQALFVAFGGLRKRSFSDIKRPPKRRVLNTFT